MGDCISREKVLGAIAEWCEKYGLDGRRLGDSINALPGVPVLTPDEAKNIAELVEIKFYQLAKELYEADELDNLAWGESILSGWRKLERMAKDE